MNLQATAKLIAELRLLVGYLGEASQHNWWSSNFLSPSSPAFLQPIYPRTVLLAQYHGVRQAALLVHDDRIGVGSNYHLYRLPELLERSAASEVQDDDFEESIKDYTANPETCLARLREIADSAVEKSEGPTIIGDYSMETAGKMIKNAAGHYLKAFEDGYQCFPYMREA